MTRSKNRLYFVELEEEDRGLGRFAFRCFKHEQLALAREVTSIDEGKEEMTAPQHKARGVALVALAIDLEKSGASTSKVKAKFEEARKRFLPDKGNDKHLLDQCAKHLEIVLMKRSLLRTVEGKFFNKKTGDYDLATKFQQILDFEQDLLQFFASGLDDPFLEEEMYEVVAVVEQLFEDTHYEIHFKRICHDIKQRLHICNY